MLSQLLDYMDGWIVSQGLFVAPYAPHDFSLDVPLDKRVDL